MQLSCLTPFVCGAANESVFEIGKAESANTHGSVTMSEAANEDWFEIREAA